MKIQRSGDPPLFFSKSEKAQVMSAIQEAEKKTSAEIRVHLERKAKDDIFAHGKAVFEKLGMAQTEARNGVLIFMGVKSKRFAILGDKGIHEKVPEGFWDAVVQKMIELFKQDRFADGICEAVVMIGESLGAYFPYQRDDVNELPDEISFSM